MGNDPEQFSLTKMKSQGVKLKAEGPWVSQEWEDAVTSFWAESSQRVENSPCKGQPQVLRQQECRVEPLTTGNLDMAAEAGALHALKLLSLVEKRGVRKKVSRLGKSQMAAVAGKQMGDVKHPAHLRAPSPLVLWLHRGTP